MRNRQHATALTALALAALPALAACGDRPGKEDDDGAAPGAAGIGAEAPAPDTARPPADTGTLVVAGKPETLAFRLYESPADFPLRFSTYVPEDVIVETTSVEGRDAVRFTGTYNGARVDDEFLWVLFYPVGTPETDARRAADEIARARGGTPVPGRNRRYPWSLAEYELALGQPPARLLGTLALGRHAGRYFHLVIAYPERERDRFLPRAHRILDEWRWKGTGKRSLGAVPGA